MKPLATLDNTDKAKLLHELFPHEVNPLLEYLKEVCADFEQHQQQYRESWDFGFFSFDEQLCFSLQALFVNDRIIKYADKVSSDEKFKLMVQLLYY